MGSADRMDLYAALFDVVKQLFPEQHPDRTAELLLERVRAATEADRGFIVVRENDRWVQKFDVDYDRARLSVAERTFSRTVVQQALEGGKVVAVDQAADDPRYASVESVVGMGAVSVRVAPLTHDDKSVGAIYLERRRGPFAPEVDRFLEELSGTAALLISRALEREALRRRNKHLERDLFAQHDFRGIVTSDPRMLELLRMVAQVADSDASVLIRGETGTGKELIARALHVNSGRARKAFITLHCSALPGNLLESELFGHVRGAFTGADRDRPGRLASALGGTLFLDEVGELPAEVQAKLLRFLQFGEIQRVGSDKVETVDARIVAATHEDLTALIAQKRFRQDLYFRLKVVELVIPPLRDRKGDILLIADRILREKWRRPGETPHLTARAERALVAHPYPGNVRELAHVLERAALLASGPEVDVDLLPPELAPQAAAPAAGRFERYDIDELSTARDQAVEAVEREFVRGLVERSGGNISQAARDSRMNRTYLQRLVGKYKG